MEGFFYIASWMSLSDALNITLRNLQFIFRDAFNTTFKNLPHYINMSLKFIGKHIRDLLNLVSK